MTNTGAPVVPPIKPLRLTLGFLVGSLLLFGVVVYSIDKNGDLPPSWVLWTLGGLAVCSHLLCQTVGFNLKPVPTGTPPAKAMVMAGAAFQASTLLRFALSEAVAIVALALSFAVLPASWMTYLIGAVLTLILIGSTSGPVLPSSARLSSGSIETVVSPCFATPFSAWLPTRRRRGSSAAEYGVSV